MMDYKKLSVLMYLADRDCVVLYNDSMSFDMLESKEHGPVLSETFRLMEGRQKSKPDGWNSRIEGLDGDFLLVKEELLGCDTDDLDELSEADCEIMDNIWEEFKDIDISERKFKRYIRRNCPEWKPPTGTHEGKESNLITVDDLCEALEFSKARTNGLKRLLENEPGLRWD